jgi:hypothetical protein
LQGGQPSHGERANSTVGQIVHLNRAGADQWLRTYKVAVPEAGLVALWRRPRRDPLLCLIPATPVALGSTTPAFDHLRIWLCYAVIHKSLLLRSPTCAATRQAAAAAAAVDATAASTAAGVTELQAERV